MNITHNWDLNRLFSTNSVGSFSIFFIFLNSFFFWTCISNFSYRLILIYCVTLKYFDLVYTTIGRDLISGLYVIFYISPNSVILLPWKLFASLVPVTFLRRTFISTVHVVSTTTALFFKLTLSILRAASRTSKTKVSTTPFS